MREARAHIFHAQPMHQQLRELKHPRQQRAHLRQKGRIVLPLGDQLIVLAHHGHRTEAEGTHTTWASRNISTNRRTSGTASPWYPVL